MPRAPGSTFALDESFHGLQAPTDGCALNHSIRHFPVLVVLRMESWSYIWIDWTSLHVFGSLPLIIWQEGRGDVRVFADPGAHKIPSCRAEQDREAKHGRVQDVVFDGGRPLSKLVPMLGLI
jgi:hypothetical protein